MVKNVVYDIFFFCIMLSMFFGDLVWVEEDYFWLRIGWVDSYKSNVWIFDSVFG